MHTHTHTPTRTDTSTKSRIGLLAGNVNIKHCSNARNLTVRQYCKSKVNNRFPINHRPVARSVGCCPSGQRMRYPNGGPAPGKQGSSYFSHSSTRRNTTSVSRPNITTVDNKHIAGRTPSDLCPGKTINQKLATARTHTHTHRIWKCHIIRK